MREPMVWISGLLVGCVMMGFALYGDVVKARRYDEAIAVCELELPRSQQCELFAAPVAEKTVKSEK